MTKEEVAGNDWEKMVYMCMYVLPYHTLKFSSGSNYIVI